jgi:hypothetical protein
MAIDGIPEQRGQRCDTVMSSGRLHVRRQMVRVLDEPEHSLGGRIRRWYARVERHPQEILKAELANIHSLVIESDDRVDSLCP